MINVTKVFTTSKKSSYFTLNNDKALICRVPSKKVGFILAEALNADLNSFLTITNNDVAIEREGKKTKLPRLTKKAYSQLTNYLKGQNNENSNQITHQSQLQSTSLFETSIQRTEGLLLLESSRSRDENVTTESIGVLSNLLEPIQSESDFFNSLDQLDRHLTSEVARGSELLDSECEIEREIGQLTIGFANLRRGQTECALQMREIDQDQQRIRVGLDDFTRNVEEFARDVQELESSMRELARSSHELESSVRELTTGTEELTRDTQKVLALGLTPQEIKSRLESRK